jgi:methylated-DNA-[protein]-cysteine S-methyltransferase
LERCRISGGARPKKLFRIVLAAQTRTFQIPVMAFQTLHHHLFDTALGRCGVAWNARGLVGVQLPERDPAATERRLAAKCRSAGAAEPPVAIASLIGDIQRYLLGERVDFSAVPVDLTPCDEFRRKVYTALRSVAFGTTTTYGDLARAAGADDWEGARDVGEAMGTNPAPLVIPCHRCLAAGGKPGGFSAYGGLATKRKLLALEGVHLERAEPRLPGL